MTTTKIIVKNYRCFSDANPLVIEFSPGFTALVGKNDAGKSTFLRMFYEFRALWTNLTGSINAMFQRTWGFNVPYTDVPDAEAIFSNTNNRPLTLDIFIIEPTEIEKPTIPYLARVLCTCERNSPNRWSFECYSNKNLKNQVNENDEAPAQKISNGIFRVNGAVDIDCNDFISMMDIFGTVLYVGPFRNAINEGAGDYFDLAIGTSFISTWNDWKTGDTKSQNRATERVSKEIRKIFEFDQLEINASNSLKTLHILIDGKPYLLPEVGGGLAQFIIVFANAAIKAPSLILIDEPELNLHPTLQIDFMTALASFSKTGVIFSTHSIGLSRSIAERIYSFQKQGDGTLVRAFEAVPNYAEFIGELSFSAFNDLGYDRILLVEGVNDVKTLQQFLRMLSKDHTTVILPLGGDQLARGGVEAELAEITRLSKNVSALVDSERPDEKKPPNRKRLAFGEVCRKLKIKVCITKRRAIENYLTDDAIKNEFGSAYGSLGPYERIQDLAVGWAKAESWRVARRMTFDDIKQTDLGKFLENI